MWCGAVFVESAAGLPLTSFGHRKTRCSEGGDAVTIDSFAEEVWDFSQICFRTDLSVALGHQNFYVGIGFGDEHYGWGRGRGANGFDCHCSLGCGGWDREHYHVRLQLVDLVDDGVVGDSAIHFEIGELFEPKHRAYEAFAVLFGYKDPCQRFHFVAPSVAS